MPHSRPFGKPLSMRCQAMYGPSWYVIGLSVLSGRSQKRHLPLPSRSRAAPLEPMDTASSPAADELLQSCIAAITRSVFPALPRTLEDNS